MQCSALLKTITKLEAVTIHGCKALTDALYEHVSWKNIYMHSSNVFWNLCNCIVGCFWFSLSNLFHGMDKNTPVRYTVYCSLLKVASSCGAIQYIPTELDQVIKWPLQVVAFVRTVLHLNITQSWYRLSLKNCKSLEKLPWGATPLLWRKAGEEKAPGCPYCSTLKGAH